MAKPQPTQPPAGLLAAFRAAEQIEDIAVLTDAEGFDSEIMRVLSAWRHTDNVWVEPKKPCPDPGMPTAASWRWLVAGWTIDERAVARAADVTESTARVKLDVLIGNRLIYPDGGMAKAALAALKSHVGKRVRGKPNRNPPENAN